MDIIVLLIILILPAIAQYFVSVNYRQCKNMENFHNLSGFEVARKILDKNGLKDIYIVETKGDLTDHYDSSRKVVRLSRAIFHEKSIASIAVAAHECGHALQDKDNYSFLRFRALIYPVVNVATSISYFIILLGVLFSSLNLVWLGITFVSFGLIFQIITLPVEFDASKRALELIKKLDITTSDEELPVKKMLEACAFTYVAGVLASALEILRLILLLGNKRD